MPRLYAGGSLESRYNKRVVKSDDPDACWDWKGSTVGGYGRLGSSGARGQKQQTHYAHRLSYVLHIGLIPDGMEVCHECDNPICSNPRHLFLGTRQENLDDMVRKGRSMVGERHPKARLSEADVRRIRARRSAGERCKDLAKEFGVHPVTISMITSGKAWAHIS